MTPTESFVHANLVSTCPPSIPCSDNFWYTADKKGIFISRRSQFPLYVPSGRPIRLPNTPCLELAAGSCGVSVSPQQAHTATQSLPARWTPLWICSAREQVQPWKKGCVRKKWGQKRTCSRCEMKKTNQDWEMWSNLGGERRPWEHPSLSTGVEELQVDKSVRWE